MSTSRKLERRADDGRRRSTPGTPTALYEAAHAADRLHEVATATSPPFGAADRRRARPRAARSSTRRSRAEAKKQVLESDDRRRRPARRATSLNVLVSTTAAWTLLVDVVEAFAERVPSASSASSQRRAHHGRADRRRRGRAACGSKLADGHRTDGHHPRTVDAVHPRRRRAPCPRPLVDASVRAGSRLCASSLRKCPPKLHPEEKVKLRPTRSPRSCATRSREYQDDRRRRRGRHRHPAVGDGIARVYGLENCVALEMLEFPHGVTGLALNLEEYNVAVPCSSASGR